MSRGARIADQLREEFFLEEKLPFSVLENICLAHNAYVKSATIDGAQGRILFSKNSDHSVITLNDRITYGPKRKFVLAHELGHRLMHFQLMNFICNESDLKNWANTNGNYRYEKEANEFAAALLMPREAFQADINSSSLNKELIKEVADKFGTSLTSACIHYTKYGNQPCYLIYSQNGTIQWVCKSEDIYWGYIEKGDRPPSGSSPRRFFEDSDKTGRDICSVYDWFTDYQEEEFSLYEESMYSESYSSVLTFLWPCDKYN